MSDSSITVWGVGTSRTLRVHWALHELGLKYMTEAIQARTGETKTDAYTRLTPKQKVPFVQDGALGLSESAAIAHYLFETYGADAGVWRPETPAARAASDEWCYFIMTELDAHSLYVIRRHDDLRAIYGAAPEAVASAREYFLKQIGAVQARIADVDSCLFGDRIAVADILLTTVLIWANRYGIPLSDEAMAYCRRTIARDGFQKAFEHNYAHLPAAEWPVLPNAAS
ncbi:MAG: glutathione S-transferase family protein [Alphaproteobacteria bacterium]|nr:glutathione S-transferase family protein [Alphaproteobacteria bacterium]